MEEITVLGGGVAGSAFAALAAYRGFRVRVVEARRNYTKPCGELVPSGFSFPFAKPLIKARIHRLRIFVDGDEAFSFRRSLPPLLVIDKQGLVASLREAAESFGASFEYRVFTGRPSGRVVDARGPFVNDGRRRIPVARAILEESIDEDAVELHFDSKLTGFCWVFPRGGGVNTGCGFLEDPYPARRLRGFIKHRFGKAEGIRIAASVITVRGGVLYRGGIFYIGEAAGLVNPLTGEGIRPAVLSAKALAEALATKGWSSEAAREYSRRLAPLTRSISIQRSVLEMVEGLRPEERQRILLSLPSWIVERIFMEGVLRLGDAARALLGRPGLLLGLSKGRIRRFSSASF